MIEDGPAQAPIGPVGRGVRLAVGILGLVLLLVGTLVGQDDAFPLGPFRMYSTTDKPDAPVRSLRLEAVTDAGTRIVLSDSDTGLRRAEIEGQLGQIRADPRLLDAVATAYHARQPNRPELAEVDVVVRLIALHEGRPTGRWQDAVEITRLVSR